jgi:glutathione S-transferase
MSDVELFSTPVCPFAHRVRLTLVEKGIPYRLTEIDLRNKPREFMSVSPHGKVPLLRRGNEHIAESVIINEYLDETFPEPPLLPRDPARRAHARFWIDFANSRLFATTASLLYGPHRQDRAPALQQIADALGFIESEALAKRPGEGPYWLGPEVSLVDLTFYPWFEQLPVLERFRDFGMPQGLGRVAEWRHAMAQRPTTRAAAKPSTFYIEQYGLLEQALARA